MDDLFELSKTITTDQKNALLKLMELEWRDIHHSRIQEWSALGAVTGAHIALFQTPRILAEAGFSLGVGPAEALGCALGALFAIIGALITGRHRNLMQHKLRWIYDAEVLAGLVRTAQTPYGVLPKSIAMVEEPKWRGLSFPRFLSTSGLMLSFYLTFLTFDLAYLIVLLSSKS
jgi:hypothetical protein